MNTPFQPAHFPEENIEKARAARQQHYRDKIQEIRRILLPLFTDTNAIPEPQLARALRNATSANDVAAYALTSRGHPADITRSALTTVGIHRYDFPRESRGPYAHRAQPAAPGTPGTHRPPANANPDAYHPGSRILRLWSRAPAEEMQEQRRQRLLLS